MRKVDVQNIKILSEKVAHCLDPAAKYHLLPYRVAMPDLVLRENQAAKFVKIPCFSLTL
jgi:hypothetical protein